MGNSKYAEWKRISYFRKLKARAMKATRNPTEAEALTWQSRQQLNRELPEGYYFQRQYVQSRYILDFYCKKSKICIEVDGSVHDNSVIEDRRRDSFLQANFGIKTLRITNEDVYDFNHRKAFLAQARYMVVCAVP